MTTEKYIKKIREKLIQLQYEKNIIVLYAAVCGSRAYNLHSPDSDCDTKFVFVYPVDKYLNINQPDEDIDLGDDIHGYELRKFLKIVYKSGFNAAELIFSPLNILGEELNDTLILKQLTIDCLNKKKLIKSFCGCAYNAIERFRHANEIDDRAQMVKHFICAARMYLMASIVYHNRANILEKYVPINFDEIITEAVKLPGVIQSNIFLTRLLNYVSIKRQGSEAALKVDPFEIISTKNQLEHTINMLNLQADSLENIELSPNIENRMNQYFKRQVWIG